MEHWLAIPAATALDLIFGDPHRLPHPVRWMGRAIETLEPIFRRTIASQRLAGTVMSLALVALTWTLTWIATTTVGRYLPGAAPAFEILLLYTCLSARSLQSEALGVHTALQANDLHRARRRLSMIVGREVDRLDEGRISMAAVETVAENLVDGFISPLFFFALGGAPLAMAFKMISTLDSMIGYRSQRYRWFGRTAARLDDAANYIPARLAVVVIALAAAGLGGRGRAALQTARFEGRHHASPNAGLPEATFAGALGVRLGGPNIYHGRRLEKPYIGAAFPPPDMAAIPRSCELMAVSALLWAAVVWTVGLAVAALW